MATPDANPDALFVRKAFQAGLAEVNAGKLAQQQGSNAAVKQFGRMMITDHGSADEALQAIATAKNVDLPMMADADQDTKMKAVQASTGDVFDRAYVGWQIVSHKEAIALFKEEIASGDDPDVKHFADITLPTLQAHLKILEGIVLPPPPSEPPPVLQDKPTT